MAMHISHFNLIGNQKSENPRLRTAAIFKKIEKIISLMSDFDKIFMVV